MLDPRRQPRSRKTVQRIPENWQCVFSQDPQLVSVNLGGARRVVWIDLGAGFFLDAWNEKRSILIGHGVLWGEMFWYFWLERLQVGKGTTGAACKRSYRTVGVVVSVVNVISVSIARQESVIGGQRRGTSVVDRSHDREKCTRPNLRLIKVIATIIILLLLLSVRFWTWTLHSTNTQE